MEYQGRRIERKVDRKPGCMIVLSVPLGENACPRGQFTHSNGMSTLDSSVNTRGPMPAQRFAHDHRIRLAIATSGDPSLFRNFSIPASTTRSWVAAARRRSRTRRAPRCRCEAGVGERQAAQRHPPAPGSRSPLSFRSQLDVVNALRRPQLGIARFEIRVSIDVENAGTSSASPSGEDLGATFAGRS